MPPVKSKPSDPEETAAPEQAGTTPEDVAALPPEDEMPAKGVVMAEGPVSDNIAVSDKVQDVGERKYSAAEIVALFSSELEAEPYLVEGVLNAAEPDEFTVAEAKSAVQKFLKREAETE